MRRPSGRPKDIFMVLDNENNILQICTTLVLASKRVPNDGVVAPITPAILNESFGSEPVVVEFLTRYDGGRWLVPKRKRKEN